MMRTSHIHQSVPSQHQSSLHPAGVRRKCKAYIPRRAQNEQCTECLSSFTCSCHMYREAEKQTGNWCCKLCHVSMILEPELLGGVI
eukprot:5006227-Amphidinium_carterae.2